jgi:hypothetical protein
VLHPPEFHVRSGCQNFPDFPGQAAEVKGFLDESLTPHGQYLLRIPTHKLKVRVSKNLIFQSYFQAAERLFNDEMVGETQAGFNFL